MYKRGWLWRKRYSDYLGGQKSGIGEGSEGVHCGREMYCLDAKEVEHVIEWNDRSRGSNNSGTASGGSEDTALNGNANANANAIDNHTSIMNGPAVAGESSVTTSDYIEVGGTGNTGTGSTSDDISNSNNIIDHHHHHHHNHHHTNNSNNTITNIITSIDATPRPRPRHKEPSYLAREVEGIGGVVRRTTSHRERIGAIVPEYEGERATGRYLEAEREGVVRSWCSWCFRVVPGIDENEEKEEG